jgi:hypothetical protein
VLTLTDLLQKCGLKKRPADASNYPFFPGRHMSADIGPRRKRKMSRRDAIYVLRSVSGKVSIPKDSKVNCDENIVKEDLRAFFSFRLFGALRSRRYWNSY